MSDTQGEHPVGAVRWVYWWRSDDWERVVVAEIESPGSRTVRMPDGKLMCDVRLHELRDQHPRPRVHDDRKKRRAV